ncbi:hypothetical protein GRI38_11195 [Altererythrobacter aurantiacus]|uniref:Lipoprotein n=1 Tax=Parapontixanthobacter aurantiacus TaxID=1463599 RepID=A0A844ZLN8_9SPHN|nr:hypothetical protein [Parapontixanthobacter aurantiacus]MXO86589.1 hypothetical protein [Parapontixanthobacter aurantiacus]
MIKHYFALLSLAFALSACAGSREPRIPDRVINRALAGATGEAQPSRIIAREIAFARAARDDGQWTAFREFAAPNALIHGRNGPIVAEPWLASQDDPDEAVRWEPRAIWMSCDGSLAVSQGRFREPGGIVGDFVTVWERQPNGEYLYTYDFGAPDNPQPVAPPKQPAIGENDIVVTAMNMVEGNVSQCATRGTTIPAPPALTTPANAQVSSTLSDDRTLRWTWQHGPAQQRSVTVDWIVDGAWQQALSFTAPEPLEN